MRLEQLQYLVAVAEAGSISVAAERLHITQPSLSQAISSLERELGIRLFTRSRGGTRLSEAGGPVLQKAREVLWKVDELVDEANRRASTLMGHLTVAVIPSLALTLLPPVLASFKRRFPHVHLSLKEVGSFTIREMLSDGRADLGLVAVPTGHEEDFLQDSVRFERLFLGEILACVSPSLAASLHNPTSFKELSTYPLVVFNEGYSLYHYVVETMKSYGDPNILFTSDNTEVTKKIVSEGVAVGFLTNLGLKADPYVSSGAVVPLHISDYPFSISFGWLKRANTRLSPAGVEFVRTVKEASSQL